MAKFAIKEKELVDTEEIEEAQTEPSKHKRKIQKVEKEKGVADVSKNESKKRVVIPDSDAVPSRCSGGDDCYQPSTKLSETWVICSTERYE